MKYLIVSIFFALSCTVYGQNNEHNIEWPPPKPDYSYIPEDYKAKFKEIGCWEASLKTFYDAKINVFKYERYNKLDVNLINVSYQIYPNYYKKMLTSPILAEIEVVSREYFPNKNNRYRTKVNMKVKHIVGAENIDRGDIISAYCFSGPIESEDGREMSYVSTNNDLSNLYIKESALVFLKPMKEVVKVLDEKKIIYGSYSFNEKSFFGNVYYTISESGTFTPFDKTLDVKESLLLFDQLKKLSLDVK